MVGFEKLLDDIYRLKVPFEGIYTSVFLIETEEGTILFDFAATVFDAENIIIPALRKLGKTPVFLVASHTHGDHVGGLKRLYEEFPNTEVLMYDKDYAEGHKEINITILENGQYICPGIKALNLCGHSNVSCVLFDERTKTLLTGDAVQLYGIGRYGLGVIDFEGYIAAINFLEKLKPENIVASHEYCPLGALALGSKASEAYLNCALECFETIKGFVLSRIKKGYSDEDVLNEYNNQGLPLLSSRRIGMFREYYNRK